jgi:cysteine-rich repeat protein
LRRESCGLAALGIVLLVARAAAQHIVIAPSDVVAGAGATGIPVAVTTSAGITVGATDLRLRFDPAALEAVGVMSPLENFTSSIDNVNGAVATASASASGDAVPAGGPLFTVTFNVRPGAPTGCSLLAIEDGDEVPPDDLAGVAPPLPPPSILVGTCGNGVVDPGEVCDDGNVQDGDCCSGGCTAAAADGVACDDGDPCVSSVCRAGECTPGAEAKPANDELRVRRFVLQRVGRRRRIVAKGSFATPAGFDPTATGSAVEVRTEAGTRLYMLAVPGSAFRPGADGISYRYVAPGGHGREKLAFRLHGETATVAMQGVAETVPARESARLAWLVRLGAVCVRDLDLFCRGMQRRISPCR